MSKLSYPHDTAPYLFTFAPFKFLYFRMKRLFVPKLLSWMLITGLVFLVFMTVMRFVFFYRFSAPSAYIGDYVQPFLLGLNFDLRIVCGIILFPFLIGQLYLKYHNKKLSTASIVRVSLAVIVMGFLLWFMKKGHMQLVIFSIMAALFLLILLWLFASKDCNPFHTRVSERVFKGYFIFIAFVIVLFYALDFEHFDYLQQRLSASIINYTGDAKISLNMIWETYPVFKLFLFIVLSIFILSFLINLAFRKISRGKHAPGRMAGFVFSSVFTILLAAGIFGRINQYPLRWSDAFAFEDDFKANLALNPVQSFLSTLQFRNSGYDIKLVKEYYPLISKYLRVTQPDSVNLNFTRYYTAPDTAPKRNVVVVICESFSAYKSSMFGNPLNTTPYFNEMCKNGIFFDRCFTPAYGTARGVWATITGTPDVEYPNTSSRNPSYVDQHSIINDYPGYSRYYFIGGSSSWANIRGLLTNNLSNIHLLEEEDFNARKVDVWGISDKRLFLNANDTFRTRKEPFVAVIQTADNHRPYTIPEEDQKEFKQVSYPEDTLYKYGFTSNAELNAFRYSDFAFEKFIEAAKKETYFKNTIFVFVGDHGLRGNASAIFPEAFTTSGINIHHVPLLFYAPAFLPAQRRHDACSQVDVFPSVSALAGISYKNTTMGINLFDTASVPGLPFAHAAFIFDPTVRQLGMVTDSVAYTKSLIGGEENLYSLFQNIPAPKKELVPLRELTTAWYQTGKYILFHNRKTGGATPGK